MSEKIERRFHEGAVELRVEGEGKAAILEGYAVKWGELSVDLGGFREKWERGAFKEDLAADADVVALFNHDRSLILGRTPKTLKVEEDATGLRYEVELPDSPNGHNVRVAIEREDVRGSSFAFRDVVDRIEQEKDGTIIRTVSKARLKDVSPATRPAFEGTEVALRSIEEWREEQRAESPEATESRERKLEIAAAS